MSWPKGKHHDKKRVFSDKAKENMRNAQKAYWQKLSPEERMQRASTWRENFSKLSKEQKASKLSPWITAGQRAAQSVVSSSIELKVKKQLKSLGILFEEQKMLCQGKFVVDFYLPEYWLVIECNGDYWHNLDERKARDKRLEEYVLSKGRDILWLWEHEINDEWFSIADYLEVS